MTENQREYLRLQEAIRHNLATEDQAKRELAERQRANYATEKLRGSELAEAGRANIAKETETNRSNLAREAEENRANLSSEDIKYKDLVSKTATAGMKTVGDWIFKAIDLIL